MCRRINSLAAKATLGAQALTCYRFPGRRRPSTSTAQPAVPLAPSDEQRGLRGIDLFVRSDADQPSRLIALIDSGETRVRLKWRPSEIRCVTEPSQSGQRRGPAPVAAPVVECD